MSDPAPLWASTKTTMEFAEWAWWARRKADLSAKLWPTEEQLLRSYEAGETITEATIQ